jgi:uncharacterized protein
MAGREQSLIVVLDASTFVSAALKANSIPEQALLHAVSAPNRLLLSHAVEDEFREVIFRPKFDRSWLSSAARGSSTSWSSRRSGSNRLRPSRSAATPRTPSNLALAAAGGADIIVSNDVRHLLSMNPWRGISILSPADFLALR